MIDDGLFSRFPCEAVYAIHNWPELPLGQYRPAPARSWRRLTALISGYWAEVVMPHSHI